MDSMENPNIAPVIFITVIILVLLAGTLMILKAHRKLKSVLLMFDSLVKKGEFREVNREDEFTEKFLQWTYIASVNKVIHKKIQDLDVYIADMAMNPPDINSPAYMSTVTVARKVFRCGHLLLVENPKVDPYYLEPVRQPPSKENLMPDYPYGVVYGYNIMDRASSEDPAGTIITGEVLRVLEFAHQSGTFPRVIHLGSRAITLIYDRFTDEKTLWTGVNQALTLSTVIPGSEVGNQKSDLKPQTSDI